MEVTDLAAQVRKEQKKGPARRLRQQGICTGYFLRPDLLKIYRWR